MLKVGRWATLGLISLGVAHLLITACRESRRNGGNAAAYTPRLALLATQPFEARPIEPRVTGGFSYAPYKPGAKNAGKLINAGRPIFEEAQKAGASSEALGAAAVALLLDRRPDQALDRLHQALAASPREPRLLSDLAATYLVRAKLKDSPYDLIQALAAADRALESSPPLAEARFNQALALTHLGLSAEAERAWRTYRDLDPASSWTAEAEIYLQQLRQPREADLWPRDRDHLRRAALAGNAEEVKRLVATYRQPARLYVEDQLLGDWAAGRIAGRIEESTQSLTIAQTVANALGFKMLDREVSIVEEAAKSASPADQRRLAALIRGHEAYARARALHEQQKYPEAEPLFRSAAAALEEGGSPFAAWPKLYLAIIVHHHSDQPQAIRMLQNLRQRFAAEDYSPLLGSIDWMIGQARGTQGPIASALTASESALRQFERAGEVENQAALHCILAWVYADLGENDTAWRHHYAALQALPRLYKPRRSQNILSAALHSLQGTGDLGPALYFQGMLIDDAVQADNPIGLAIALRDQAAIFHKLGRTDEAFSDLDRVRQVASRMGDPLLRQSVEVDTLLAEGRIFRASRPDAALKALDQALAVSLQQGNRHLLIQILQERAESWLSLGREPEAEKDLEAGLAELERQRRILTDDTLRVFFADQGRALLEERIALQRLRGEKAEATLDTVERLRARALLDVVGDPGPAGWPEPRDAGDLAAALPAGTALVEYLWVRDKLVAWIITHNGVEAVDLEASQEHLEDLVHRYVRALKEGQDFAAMASDLHHRLIAPLERSLAGASTLIVIPDGELCHLPFAALQDGSGSRFLVETYRLATAPSASVYLSLAERYRERAGTPPTSILLVGEPEYDHSLFPGLSSLKDAKKEIAALAGFYSRSRLLTGGDATPEKLLSALPDPDVFHFAGHTITTPGAASPSLLLAPSEKTRGASLLSAEGIRSPRPPRARLVVLAGCRTAEGRLSQNEGTLGLARAFLAAGIPTVVASHWDADDQPTFELLRRFNHYFRDGADPLAALRQAQLDLLRDSNSALSSPRTWAAFQVIGGAFAPAGDLPPPGSVSH